jgi:hypothetical protein
MVKAQYYGGLFQPNYNESEHMHLGVQLVIGLFHYKKLCFSLMIEYRRTYLENESDIFRRELEAQITLFFDIVKLEIDFEHFACAFFKFFLQLKSNPVLAKSEKWNKYVRFRMRHFYWIDPKVCIPLLKPTRHASKNVWALIWYMTCPGSDNKLLR